MEAKKLIIDIETCEEKIVDYEENELAEYLASSEAEKQKYLANKAQNEAKQAARQTALDKLKAIGLTEEEIAALVGA